MQRSQDSGRGRLPRAPTTALELPDLSRSTFVVCIPDAWSQVAHVQYYIRPGTVDGGVCHVRGEGSCEPGEEPGDIQVKISVQKHERYTLKGSDLICTQRVALAELLQGQLVRSSTIHFHCQLFDAYV
jgi:hypothetical protein